MEMKSWKVCEEMKGKHSRQVPHCNFHFVALLLFLMKQFSIGFQFFNCNIFFGGKPNWFYNPEVPATLPSLKNPGSAPVLFNKLEQKIAKSKSFLTPPLILLNLVLFAANKICNNLLWIWLIGRWAHCHGCQLFTAIIFIMIVIRHILKVLHVCSKRRKTLKYTHKRFDNC